LTLEPVDLGSESGHDVNEGTKHPPVERQIRLDVSVTARIEHPSGVGQPDVHISERLRETLSNLVLKVTRLAHPEATLTAQAANGKARSATSRQGREPAQVQHRQHVVDLRRPPRVRRQDRRREALPLASLDVHALVLDARRADRDRARPDRQLPLPGAAIVKLRRSAAVRR
jgi:hypothetical protein